MELTEAQRAMLAGSEGAAVGLCLKSLIRYGDAFGARCLVPIKSAHLTGSFRIYFYSAYYELVGRLVREGVRFRVPTTLNPHPGYDFSPQNRIVFRGQREHEAQLEALGVIPNYSCVCYHHHNVPELGDVLGWAESSAVIWANSVRGARTNRNSIMMDICQAVTGLTPEFGYLLDENRRGQLLVQLDIERMDAPALGYLIGKIAVDRVPVLTHYPFSQTELKNMGAAMASSGGVTLFHVLGLTPEAPTLDAVFDREPADVVTVTQKDLEALSAAPGVQNESGLVVFGCPQMTLEEAEEIGRYFVGKRVNRRVLFHVMPDAYQAFSRTPLCQEVREAGVEIWQHCPLAGLSLRIGLGRKQVLTPSGKLYYYLANTTYGTLDEVLRVVGVGP
jgi:phosphomecalonate degydratase large subunit